MARVVLVLGVVGTLVWGAGRADAQSLGTFRWQLRPYCNVVTVSITQSGGLYRVEGTDDQCGGGRDLASLLGMAFPNPDGTIGFGMTIVTAPGGVPVHVDAEITVATLSGTWRDSAGNTGTFAFTPGAGAGGSPRPPAAPAVPPSITFAPNGGLVAISTGAGDLPPTGSGTRLVWHAAKGAFRAGTAGVSSWDDASIGPGSVAFGNGTAASGRNSVAAGTSSFAGGANAVAFGSFAAANGQNSLAVGSSNIAQGSESVAFGLNARAIGDYSLATGEGNRADGLASLAFGGNTTANGAYSVAGGLTTSASGRTALAFGANASAGGRQSVALGTAARTTVTGSFMFADASTTAVFQSSSVNEFGARFAGGYYLYTNANLTAGAQLLPGSGAWSNLSDANVKENFRDVDGEDLLGRLATVPVRAWNYKAQGAAIRHLGPTAQDFHAAFGLGELPLRINTIDADGVAIAAAKALDARTRRQSERIEALERQLAEALAALQALRPGER